MDHSAEFHDMSARRADQLLVRLGMAVCIGVFAYTLKPSIWPGLWFVAVVVTQLFENFWVDRPLRRKKPALSARTRILIAALSGFNAAVFVSLSIYSWSDGSAGQMFATMLICGGLLHVCLHLYTVRMVQVAGAFAPCLFLFALPVISEIQHSGLHPAAIFVMLMSAALYLAHLLLGVSQNNQINSSLIAANAHAQQQQKLAEAESRSKSDFLATISHEIRTPLNAVTSAAHLLNETDMSERQEEFVSILLNGSEVLLNLINEVLDMSKIEAGKMTLDITDVDLHELASKILGLWKGPAEQRGLSIEVTIDPSAPQFNCGCPRCCSI